MKVAIAHSEYLSGPVSGENAVVKDETRLLREAGHEVRVLQLAPSNVGGLIGNARLAASAVWSRDGTEQFLRLLHHHKPDVVHVHNLFPMLSPAVLRLNRDCPLVMTLHNYRLQCLPATFYRDGRVCEDCHGRATPWPGIIHACYRDSTAGSATLAASLSLHRALRSFERIDRFLAVSNFIKQKHVEAGISTNRIRVKPNFAWPSRRRNGPGSYFLFMGRVAPEKGLSTVVAATQSHPRLELVVAGDGPDLPRLRSVAGSNVRFLGPVERDKVTDLLVGARAIVVPSRWYEGAPRAVAEAFAAGVPVLASDIGALPEFIDDGRTGILVDMDNGREWTAAMETLLDDAESQRMGEAAYACWRERFSPERGLKDLEAAYSVSS